MFSAGVGGEKDAKSSDKRKKKGSRERGRKLEGGYFTYIYNFTRV
jgi:hypothetical protein